MDEVYMSAMIAFLQDARDRGLELEDCITILMVSRALRVPIDKLLDQVTDNPKLLTTMRMLRNAR
jgi:hypothetical protein